MRCLWLRAVYSAVCLFTLLIRVPSVWADEVRVFTFVYPPLTLENGTGISNRLVEAAFATTGSTVQFTYVPVKRAMATAIEGDGFYLGAPFKDASGTKLNFAPMVELQTTLLYSPKRFFFSKYQTPKQVLGGRKIGLLRGYENNPLVSTYGLIIEAPSNNESAMRMFAAGRIDFLPCIKIVECPTIAQQAQALGADAQELPFDVAPVVSLGLIYRADNTQLEQQASKFLTGLAAIKKNGAFSRALDKK
jgi:ABC-type amino acid transport substrate-binding protein